MEPEENRDKPNKLKMAPIGELSQTHYLWRSSSWLQASLLVRWVLYNKNLTSFPLFFYPVIFLLCFQTKSRLYQNSGHQILLTLVSHGTVHLVPLQSPKWQFWVAENAYIHNVFPQEPEISVETFHVGIHQTQVKSKARLTSIQFSWI